MDLLVDSFFSALLLLKSFNAEVLAIVGVSLKVSSASTVVASVIGIPAGFWIAFEEFRGKRITITILNTLLALPTVVVGLFVYAFITRRGIFGPLDLLYTSSARSSSSCLLWRRLRFQRSTELTNATERAP